MRFQEGCLTQWQAEHSFQLDPAPPPVDELNDYVLGFTTTGNVEFFSHFLHAYEPQLNKRVRCFLLSEGYFSYDPERFLEYKLACVQAMLEVLPNYDPDRGASFLTYAYHFIENAMLYQRMMEEAGSFSSLDEYLEVRHLAWLYSQHGEDSKAAVQAYTGLYNTCSEKRAEELLTVARKDRNRVSLDRSIQENEFEDTGEDVGADEGWENFDVLWNSEDTQAVRAAFQTLNFREQFLLERRNAICMTCGRVSSLSTRWSFEQLSDAFEGSRSSGAQRAYEKSVAKLTERLVRNGTLHAVELRKKKNAAAVYEYRADCDGAWGEIQFDRKQGTVEILALADGDSAKTHSFAKKAISYLRATRGEKPQSKYLIPFRMERQHPTLEQVLRELTEDGKISTVSIRLKFKPSKKSSVVVYEYCADFDNCWGKLEIDMRKKTANILALAEGDTVKSNVYASMAIQAILAMEPEEIPQKLTIPFKR